MITFEDKGISYNWEGGFGCVFESFENGLKQGQVRYINHRLYYVFSVRKKWYGLGTDRVAWGMVEKAEAEILREIKSEMFHV